MALLIEADMKRTGMKKSFLSRLSQLFPGRADHQYNTERDTVPDTSKSSDTRQTAMS